MVKPLVELQNFGSSTHVIVCGLDISTAVYGIKYWIKEEQHQNFKKKRPILRLDIDLVECIEYMEKISKEDLQSALEILEPYLHDRELLKHWRSRLRDTPGGDS